MAGGSPEAAFDLAWQTAMQATVDLELGAPAYAGLKRDKKFVNAQVQAMARLFSERRKVQGAVFNHLRGVLGNSTSLVDFLSGDAVSTIPLVSAGVLDKLYLVDGGFSPNQVKVSEKLAKRLRVQGKVELRRNIVNESSFPLNLGLTNVGVLTDSGIALPPAHRMPERPRNPLSPVSYRGSHVMYPRVTLQDVLYSFNRAGREGAFYLVETPFVEAPLSVGAWEDHLARQSNGGTGWRLEHVAPLLEETGTMLATYRSH